MHFDIACCHLFTSYNETNVLTHLFGHLHTIIFHIETHGERHVQG